MEHSTTATVRFNVGGTIYQVSRSLLEQHPDSMLARMVSKEWQTATTSLNDNDNDDNDCDNPGSNNTNNHPLPIFVEGDGPRFRYVLEYLRRGRVWLPPPTSASPFISKQALLDDLDYYGFPSVSPVNVQYEETVHNQPPSDMVHQWCTELAAKIATRYQPKRGSDQVLEFRGEDGEERFRLAHLVVLGHYENVLAERLEALGLVYRKSAEYSLAQKTWKFHVCSKNSSNGRSSSVTSSYAGGGTNPTAGAGGQPSGTQQTFLLRRQGN